MKKVFGFLSFLLGVLLLLWIGYNLFIQMQPEAEGRNPIIALLVSGGLIYTGVKWIKEKRP